MLRMRCVERRNCYEEKEVKEIPLTSGFIALVDNEDYKYLSQYRWIADKSKTSNTWYAVRYFGQKKIYMHREILGFPSGRIDHRNRNGLDNQKENLRSATASQNGGNSIAQAGAAFLFGMELKSGNN